MPNHDAHRIVGSIAGGGAASWKAQGQLPMAQLIETLGGVGGGILGARMPDVIDPPTSPRHRSVGHGIAPVGAAAWAFVKSLRDCQDAMRHRSDVEHYEYQAASSLLAQAAHLLLSLLWRLGSGVLVGFVAGYLSHIAMDFTTPAGLPVFF